MFASLLTLTRFRPLFMFCSVCLMGVTHLAEPLCDNVSYPFSFYGTLWSMKAFHDSRWHRLKFVQIHGIFKNSWFCLFFAQDLMPLICLDLLKVRNADDRNTFFSPPSDHGKGHMLHVVVVKKDPF